MPNLSLLKRCLVPVGLKPSHKLLKPSEGIPHRRDWRWYQTLRPKNDTKYKNRPVLRDYLSYKIAGSMRMTLASLSYMYANLWLQPFRTKQDFVWRKSSNLRLQSTKLGWFIKTFHSPGGKPLHIVLLQLKQLIIITINIFWVMV